MNKLSLLGNEILKHKVEINKDYPEIIKNALIDAVKLKLNESNYNDIIEDFQSVTIDTDSFRTVLFALGSPFCKTQEELLVEYKELLSYISEILNDNAIKGEIDVERDAFVLKRSFLFNDAFFEKYFGIKESDMSKHMKASGFIQYYARYRFPQIIKNIIEELDYDGDKFKIDTPLAYFENDKNSYGVDLLIVLDIEEMTTAKDLNEIDVILEKITALKESVVKGFEVRMVQ